MHLDRGWLRTTLPLAVIAIGGFVVIWMVATREPPPRTAGPSQANARPVHTLTVERKTHTIDVHATGTVRHARSVAITPEVAGRLVEVHPELAPGLRLEEGELLARIDPTDFKAAVEQAEAQLAEAESDLSLERGRQAVAQAELSDFAGELDVPIDNALASREPQLKSAKAAVKRARAQLTQTKADLARTAVRAPFDALVVSESVDVGSQVGPQTQLAELVGTDAFWVRATVPIGQLGHVAIPGYNAERGAEVTVRQDVGTRRVTWQGKVLRLYGDVTPQGRLAQVLISVPDPLKAEGVENGGLPLLLDAFVDVTLHGRQQRELARLARQHLHEDDTVWLYANGRLELRQVNVVWRAENHVLIDEGLADGERVITTPLSNPIPGLRLKLAGHE